MNAPFFWHRPSLMGYALSPLSLLYWWAACLRTARYEAEVLPVPVICVGNNTVGGSGKTPTVIACAKLLQAQGRKPHVISRGYKGHYEGTVQVDPSKHSAEEVGDEPLLIAQHVPCWVSAKRIDAALAAITEGADCILMDDGMQNPTLHKHLTIMVVDGSYGFGNKQMLPAGPCREPISVSMLKTEMLLVMGEATHPDVASIVPLQSNVFYASLVPTEQAEDLSGKSLLAFAGIGRPEKFFKTLRTLGANVAETAPFPDHHAYTENELQQLEANAKERNAVLMTTEKDWIRLPEPWRQKIAYLPVKARIQDEPLFQEQLLAAVRGNG